MIDYRSIAMPKRIRAGFFFLVAVILSPPAYSQIDLVGE